KTDTLETTAIVTWLQSAADPELVLYYQDDQPPKRVEPPTMEQLATLTAHRTGPNAGFDRTIDYALFRDPSGYLTAFDLIDPPGLPSLEGDDSANTLRHLDPRVSTADALLYVFDRNPHEDEDTSRALSGLQHDNDAGLSEVSPLTAM